MTSMLESTPKPIKATLPASRPAAMATTPSMTFQPTVKSSSHRATMQRPAAVQRQGLGHAESSDGPAGAGVVAAAVP
jgi:hypothetical protein